MSKKKLSGKALVVQLTESELRVVKTTLGAALPQLQETYSAPLPEGAVEDGAIRSLESVRAALAAALDLPEFKKIKRVVFALTTSQVIAETATIPAVPTKRLAQMLEANFDVYFPIDTTNYHMEWQQIGKEGKELTIQMWAVPTFMVGPYYEVANSLGLSVLAIDYAAHALASAAGVSYAIPAAKAAKKAPAKPKKAKKVKGEAPAEEADLSETSAVAVEEHTEAALTELYLMAEPESLLMLFVQNGQVKMQRAFQCGYNMEAELGEVAMALDYFETVSGGSAGSRCVLCGSLADDDQFVLTASRVLNVPVQVLPALNASKWTLCVGASRTDLDFGVAELNRPGGVGEINNAWQYGLILVGGIALAMMIVTTLGSKTVWNTTISGLQSTQQTLQIQAAQNANYAQNYYDYQSAYTKYSSDWETVFASLHTYNDNLSLVFEELETILPDEVNVTGVNIADSGISLGMACEDKETIAYTIMALRKLQYGQFAGMSNLVKPGTQAYPTPATMYNTVMTEAAPTVGSGYEPAPTVGTGYEGYEPAPTVGTNYGDLLGMLTANPETVAMLQVLVDEGYITEDVVKKVISSGATTPEEIAAIILQEGSFSSDDMMATLFEMSPEEFDALEDEYAAVPDLDQDLDKLLAKATFNQRKNAMSLMLNSDPIAMYRFFNLFKEDMNRPGEEAVLHTHIYDGVWENIDALMLLVSGDMTNAEKSIPVLVKLLIHCEDCLSSTEKLFREDSRLEYRYAMYLGMEMGELKLNGTDIPKLEPSDIIEDLKNGTVPPELEPLLKQLLPPELWELLFPSNDPDDDDDRPTRPSRPNDDDDDDDNSGNTGNTGNTDNYGDDQRDHQNQNNNNNQNDAMQDLLNQLLNNQLNNNNGLLPGYGDGTAQVPQQPVDERYHFTVVLMYKPELIQAERERKGLDYDLKVEELEVAK